MFADNSESSHLEEPRWSMRAHSAKHLRLHAVRDWVHLLLVLLAPLLETFWKLEKYIQYI